MKKKIALLILLLFFGWLFLLFRKVVKAFDDILLDFNL